jgi:hypothetical protein
MQINNDVAVSKMMECRLGGQGSIPGRSGEITVM